MYNIFEVTLTPLNQIFAPVRNALPLFKLILDFFIGCKSYEIQPSPVAPPS